MNSLNSTDADIDESLLVEAGRKIARLIPTNDCLLLLQWRLVQLCQYFFILPAGEAKDECRHSLQKFVYSENDGTLAHDIVHSIERVRVWFPDATVGILPTVPIEKQVAVRAAVEAYSLCGDEILDKAENLVSTIRTRLLDEPRGVLLSGVLCRFDLLVDILRDGSRSNEERTVAAAALLYVHEVADVIPDQYGLIGLLDDDFALRFVLTDLLHIPKDRCAHWSETICALWEDLPFLQNVQLLRNGAWVELSWLDRINAYIACRHAFNHTSSILILEQPIVDVDPLYTILALVGRSVLEGLTAIPKPPELVLGQLYSIDGRFFARYRGMESGRVQLGFAGDSRSAGEIKVGVSASVKYRMTACDIRSRRESKYREFSEHFRSEDGEPIQRFFSWDQAIGAGRLKDHVIVVTSKERAKHIFGGVSSNGVDLIESGLVRLLSSTIADFGANEGPVMVVPDLRTVHDLQNCGVRVHTVLIDGFERLVRWRHEFDFVHRHSSQPVMIVWATAGERPERMPPWLGECTVVATTVEDLADIVGLEDVRVQHGNSVELLRRCSRGHEPVVELIDFSNTERDLIAMAEQCLRRLHQAEDLPDYWRYLLGASAFRTKILIGATATTWEQIQSVTEKWRKELGLRKEQMQKWLAAQCEGLFADYDVLFDSITSVHEELNSKGRALLQLLSERVSEESVIVCDRREQFVATAALVDNSNFCDLRLRMINDLQPLQNCIVTGWTSERFSRRLWAHVPDSVLMLLSRTEQTKWQKRFSRMRESRISVTRTLGIVSVQDHSVPPTLEHSEENFDSQQFFQRSMELEEPVRACIIWFGDCDDVLLLESDSMVMALEGESVKECRVGKLSTGALVLIGSNSYRWSPADEFTQSVIRLAEERYPEHVRRAREWRLALARYSAARGLSIEQLRTELDRGGIERVSITIDGWLRVERATPIAPMGFRNDLERLWRVAGTYFEYSVRDIAESCEWLRKIHREAASMLLGSWKGEETFSGLDQDLLLPIVTRLRQEVRAAVATEVATAMIPKALIGCWLPESLAEQYLVSGWNVRHGR